MALVLIRRTPAGVATAISSATINSDGDTLTCVFNGTLTISDSTGFATTFDNQAERILTYASGSGTNTILFSISANPAYTAVGTNNDAAPVGTVCTLAITGVGSVGDETAFAVTNNSTVHPEPDLPGNLPATTLPTGWDGTADYTPADMAALNALTADGTINGTAENWTVVELDGTYTGQWVIDDAVEYVVFRTADFAGLPAVGTRIADAEANLATVTYVGTATDSCTLSVQKGSSAPGASHLRFVGIKFEMTGSYTDIVNIVTIGQVSGIRDTSELPIDIGFNHCWVTHSNDTECRVALRFDALDSFFVDGRFTNLADGGEDGSTGIRGYVCQRLLIDNTFFEVESAGVFFGDNNTTRCDDIHVSNCQITRPSAWEEGDDLMKAPGFEVKTGLRVLLENNYIENGTWGAAAFGAFTIKAGEPTIDVTDKWTRHVTIRNNDVYNCKLGFSLNEKGSGSVNDQEGPCLDILVENNVFRGTTTSFAGFINGQGDDDGTFDRIIVRNNTLDQQVFCSGTKPMRYLVFKDNILTGFNANTYGAGAAALNNIWGSLYDFQYNALVGQSAGAFDDDTSPTPTGTLDNNLFPADFSTIGYTTYPAVDLADHVVTGGVCDGAASDTVSDIGADVASLITIMSGVVE